MENETKYFIQVVGDEVGRGWFYKQTPECLTYAQKHQLEFVVEEPFMEGFYEKNEEDLREISKDDYIVLKRLNWLQAEQFVEKSLVTEVGEKIIELAEREVLV